MRLYVQLLDDDGNLLAEHDADACQPSVWNAPPDRKFIGSMPQNSSDVVNNGTYQLFRITFQPVVKVDRPNGWLAPLPSPGNGQPFSPQNLAAPKPKYPWDMTAPTPLPKPTSFKGQ